MITSRQMRMLEDHAEKQGVSKLTLMERAGKGVYKLLDKWYDLRQHNAIVFCGAGNNGGDGFVAARHLSAKSLVVILLFGDEEKMTSESAANLARIQGNPRIEIMRIDDITHNAIERINKKLDSKRLVLIDAMLGTGVRGLVREPIATGIRLFNRMRGKKVAIDIPSGIDPDSGKPAGMMAIPDKIITFHDTKPGLARFHDVTVADIGILRNHRMWKSPNDKPQIRGHKIEEKTCKKP